MLNKALKFATEAHGDQKRKYSDLPYVTHPVEVMGIVKQVSHTEAMLVAALLHDVVEDTPVTLEDIQREFGDEVAVLVEMLTDVSKPEQGNRKVRKEIDRQHTAKASPQAKTIKLADLISNTTSIVEHDKAFAKTYLKEKAALLEVLIEGDLTLYKEAQALLEESLEEVFR